MSRRLLRLVSCVSLAAFALTQPHVGFAWPQSGRPAPVDAASTESNTPRCKHCCAKRDKSSKPASQPVKPSAPQSDHPTCPCCPPGDHSCPFPGGCSLCSVAKAPCLNATPATEPSAAQAGECTLDLTVAYVAPVHAGLMRPPRV
ncbi:MAG: hypothetical protein L0Y71_22650 [Gemmataceae bacterium]|nr:hypothetical protein [Gemmataceae bacterium]